MPATPVNTIAQALADPQAGELSSRKRMHHPKLGEILEIGFRLLETAFLPRTTVQTPFRWSKGEQWKDLVFTPEQPWKSGEVEQDWLRKKEVTGSSRPKERSDHMATEVIVYFTPLCAPCERLKQYLRATA